MRLRPNSFLVVAGALLMVIGLSGAGPTPPTARLMSPYDGHTQMLLDDICSKTRALQKRLGWENDHKTYLELGDILELACRKLYPPQP